LNGNSWSQIIEDDESSNCPPAAASSATATEPFKNYTHSLRKGAAGAKF